MGLEVNTGLEVAQELKELESPHEAEVAVESEATLTQTKSNQFKATQMRTLRHTRIREN